MTQAFPFAACNIEKWVWPGDEANPTNLAVSCDHRRGRDARSEHRTFSSAAHRENWKTNSSSWIARVAKKELLLTSVPHRIPPVKLRFISPSMVFRLIVKTYRELVATAIDYQRPACNHYSSFPMTDYTMATPK